MVEGTASVVSEGGDQMAGILCTVFNVRGLIHKRIVVEYRRNGTRSLASRSQPG